MNDFAPGLPLTLALPLCEVAQHSQVVSISLRAFPDTTGSAARPAGVISLRHIKQGKAARRLRREGLVPRTCDRQSQSPESIQQTANYTSSLASYHGSRCHFKLDTK